MACTEPYVYSVCKVPTTASTTTFSSYKFFSYSLEDMRLGNHIYILLFGVYTPASSLVHCKRASERKPMVSTLSCLTFMNLCLHNRKRSNTGWLFTTHFLICVEMSLPGIQEIQSHRIFCRICSSLQTEKIPAYNDAIQATKNAFHQPWEDTM